MFNAADYLDKLSMHGPAGNLSESESRAVWTEIRRRMNEPEPAEMPLDGVEETACESL
jgi:hypothetical protein